MQVPSEMEFWQDYKREQDLARYSGRAFRLSLPEYAELRLHERQTREQGRYWRRTALRNVVTPRTGISFGRRFTHLMTVAAETFQKDLRAGHDLRIALGRGINPGAVPVRPAVGESPRSAEEEIKFIDRQREGLKARGRVSYGPPSVASCGAVTTKGGRCLKPRPCPYHGSR